MGFFNTFRGRLLVVLAFLLVVTIGFQYVVNLSTQDENIKFTERRAHALLDGFALGVNSMTSRDRLRDFVKRVGQPIHTGGPTAEIADILVIDSDWQVYDSLSGNYLPADDEKGETVTQRLKDITDLPPLIDTEGILGSDISQFPGGDASAVADREKETYPIPVETDQGRFYVLVILRNDRQAAQVRAAQPLIYTLGIFLVSTIITILLVWRFTSPIANLSKAARRVGRGDLSFRLPEGRSDEVGKLTKQFNLMTGELEQSRLLEEQLREAEKSAVVGRLASAIAHEIRNPLNYINLTLDHLRNKFKPGEPVERQTFEKLTSQLKSEVERINRQVSDFLGYTRPSTLNMALVDLRTVVDASLRIVEPQAREHGVTVSIVEREDVPAVLGDAEVLRSVFNNLFLNSLQAMEKTGGRLAVVLSEESGCVRIEVTDTGNGIPEEDLENIFQPYFSTKETGTGLGLAIVKKIIDDHGGQIAARSTLREGTEFVIKLPEAEMVCGTCGDTFAGLEKCPEDDTALEPQASNCGEEDDKKVPGAAGTADAADIRI